jgi:hypothetical protein
VDGTRARRTRDKARRAWYAQHRQRRFARFLGFGDRVRDAAPPRRPAPGAPQPHEHDRNDHAVGRAMPARAAHDVQGPLLARGADPRHI